MRFCHMDIEWCWGFLRKSGGHHNNMDKILWVDLLFVVTGLETWSSAMEQRRKKSRMGSVLLNRVQGCRTLEGTEKAIWVHLVSALVFTSTLLRTHTLPSPTHLCTFVHSSCEVQFWGWEHNYNRRIATTLTKSLKRYSQTEIRDSRSTSSPTSCI